MAAPTYFNSASNPADNGTASEPVTLAVTPPTSMTSGDLVLLIGQMQVTTAGAITLSAQGGQSWSSASVVTGANDQVMALFWCQFNGTWSADPSLAFAASGGTQPTTAIMHVFRPASAGTWKVDTAIAGGAEASASPVVITGITPNNIGSVVLASWMIPNVSTWGTLSGAGWAVTGAAQYRNQGGTDQSASFAHQLQDAIAATGDVSKVPSTTTAGISWTMAWTINTRTTNTQTSTARVQKSATQTITSVARIQKSVTRTITSVARLQKIVTQTIASTGRVQKTTTQTITSTANIASSSTTRTVTSTARIQKAATQTVTSIARLQATTTRTITSTTRIQGTITRTQTSAARVQKSAVQTITSVGRVQKTVPRTITSIANIRGTTLRTIISTARIAGPGGDDPQVTMLRTVMMFDSPFAVFPHACPPRKMPPPE